MKKIYLSYPLSPQTPLYGGADNLKIEQSRSIKKGDTSNNQFWQMPNHAGTHIDFPFHFGQEGKNADDYAPDFWFFEHIFVLDLPCEKNQILEAEHWANQIPQNTDFLIIKTGFYRIRGTKEYWNENPTLSPASAEVLKAQCPQLRVLGLDTISLSGYQNRTLGRESHKAFLLAHDILIVEDMDLRFAQNPIQSLVCLPFWVAQTDGSPVSIVAQIA